MSADKVIQLVQQLQPDELDAVQNFIESLLKEHGHKSPKKLKQTWAGCLSEYKNVYDALELQKNRPDPMDEINVPSRYKYLA